MKFVTNYNDQMTIELKRDTEGTSVVQVMLEHEFYPEINLNKTDLKKFIGHLSYKLREMEEIDSPLLKRT